ncbi:MAG: LysR family transcriptional regulator, partial [Deltaproteobacteria bacterium]|nr:LysR family transcriptional regulator [Deltaproteobacteria bacterium]
LVSYGLWKDELLLALPLNHPLSRKKQVSATEILGETFIVRERGSGTWKIIEESLKAFTGKGIESLEIAATVGTSAAVKECVKGGLGISILSSRAMETELKTGVLKALRIKDLPLSRTFCLIRDRRRTASPPCQAMLDFLLGTAEEG